MNSKNQILLLFILCLFLPATAQHEYGSFYTGDMYVNYIKSENKTEDAAMILVPGANLSSYIYITTPDGRKGWSELFADAGYDVYMVNDPKYDFATGGIISPYEVPSDGKEATVGSEQGRQNDIWRRWGFGSSAGQPYEDALFPTDQFDTFAKYYPYLGSTNQSYSGLLEAVIDSAGGQVWLLAHSAGASRAVSAAREKSDKVNGLILIEPAGPPDEDDFPDLNGLHMFGVYGDYITSRNQTNRKLATESAAEFFKDAGGIADVVSLPEDSMVNGNSHMLMQDKNSHDVFDIVQGWLEQFSTSTASVSDLEYIKNEINIYPNPCSGDWLNIQTKDKDLKVSIYSFSGTLVSKSENTEKLDITDLEPGIYNVIFYGKQGTRAHRLIVTNQN